MMPHANRTILLARTFFGRFFETDLMPPGLPQVQLVIWSMALLASPGLLVPMKLAAKYVQLERNPVQLERALLTDPLIFITLTMTAMGLVALIIWDGVFPDRRDARILGALPVAGPTIIGARLLALAALAAIFLAGINLVPTFVYGPVMAAYGGAATVIRGALAHLITTTFAGLFVFGTLVSLQGLVLNIGGRRAAERLSLVLQLLFIVSLLQMIFFLPRLGKMLPSDLAGAWLPAIPSLWFLGLYDVLGGRAVVGAGTLATLAVGATALTVSAAAGVFVATHGRLTRLAIESQDGGKPRHRAVASLLDAVTRVFARRATSRAIFEFALRTLARSRSHRLLLSTYIGVALALVASAVVPPVLRSGLAAFAQPSVETLSIPLVIGFFTIVGIRVAVAIPVEPKANWIFRIREPADRDAAINGTRAMMLLIGVVPTTVLAGISAGALWGWWPALAHPAVCGAMGWLLTELLLIRIDKMPFTCTYLPGRSRIGILWPLYLTGLITYCYTIAAIEMRLFIGPARVATFLAVVALVIALLTIRRHQWLSDITSLRFQEEDPAMMFPGFQLSEGIAATAAESRRLR
jgi:hypothetical protein